jgi:hypothetical protein
MMRRWLRLLISVLALAAALAGATGGASAGMSHHHCAAMAMDDYPGDGDDGSAPPCNESALCAGQQTLLAPHLIILAPTVLIVKVSPPRGFTHPRGLSSPPDLRPPIV